MDPTTPEGARPGEPTGSGAPRSRFEDLSDFEVPVPPTPTIRRRPAIVTTAAAVLFVSALMNGIVVVAFTPTGSSLWVSAGLTLFQAVGAVLVVLLVPAGRWVGIALGLVGVVIGVVVAAGGGAASGLVTMGLNGFVIYALAASGPSFRRG